MHFQTPCPVLHSWREESNPFCLFHQLVHFLWSAGQPFLLPIWVTCFGQISSKLTVWFSIFCCRIMGLFVNPSSWSEVFLSFSWIIVLTMVYQICLPAVICVLLSWTISFTMVYQICFPAIIFASFVGRFSFKSFITRVWMEVYCLTLPLPPSLPVTFLQWVWVHGVACKEYYDYILFLRIYVSMFLLIL